MKQEEHREQVFLFAWAAWAVMERPELALLFAVPNGGLRDAVTGKRLKDEGVKAGVPDIILPVPRGAYHGLFIELKAGKNRPTAEQRGWLEALEGQGYRAAVCYGAAEARALIEEYLG